MSKSSMNNARPASVEDQAIAWMARKLSGEMSPEEMHHFEEWLQAPRHHDAYKAISKASASTDVFAEDLLAESFEAELHELAAPTGRRTHMVAMMSSLAATLLVAVGVSFFFLGQPANAPIQYATYTGEQKSIPMEDGSTITLNTATELDVTYDKEQRLVSLQHGEAFFDVAKDRSRKFSVLTGHGRITVTGTSFNVRKLENATYVSVVSGAVDVRPEGRDIQTLLAGEAIAFGENITADKSKFDATRILSWRSGRVVFEDTPLAEVTAELNRYLSVPLVLSDDAPADAPVTGEFDISNPSTTIRGLSLAMSLEAARGPDRVVLSPVKAEE